MNCVKNIILKNSTVLRGFSTSSSVLSSSKSSDLGQKTALYDFHEAQGGKIVNFAGYFLPVQYADQGISQSHIHTRTAGCASIFDVSFLVIKKLNSSLIADRKKI